MEGGGKEPTRGGTGTETWRERGGTNDQRLESRGKLARSGSPGLGWGGRKVGGSGGGVLGNGAGQWQRAEQRQGGCLELGGPSVPRALAPVLLPSLHLPHFPSALPPHTPQGSRFRFAVESLRGLIPSSVTLHPCGGWRAPCLFPQAWVSPPPPPRLPHPPAYSLSQDLLPFSANCKPFPPSVPTVALSSWPALSLVLIPSLSPLTSQNFITALDLPPPPAQSFLGIR